MKTIEQCVNVVDDPRLASYWPSERRAIIVHKYFLGVERGYGPTLEEAIASWEERHAHTWRCEKMRRDAEAQLALIERHREQLAREANRPVSFAEAARDWVQCHERAWRTAWEQSAVSGA